MVRLKKQDEKYLEFAKLYEEWASQPNIEEPSIKLKSLALSIEQRYSVKYSSPDTPVVDGPQKKFAIELGRRLLKTEEYDPHVIFVSPYLRTRETLDFLMQGYPRLKSRNIRIYEDERIREQSRGLCDLYGDCRCFFVQYPEQLRLFKLEGPYWYKWPQGENVPEVRSRLRSWVSTLIREFAENPVWAVSHHLTLLALRANLERLTAEEFLRIDKEDKPVNLGVTKYVGKYRLGKEGRFVLRYYNKSFINTDYDSSPLT